MSDFNNEHSDNILDDVQDGFGKVQDAYETAKDAYDKGKEVYDFVKDHFGDTAKEAGKEAGKEALKEGVKEAGKEALKEGAKEALKEGAKEAGKELAKEGGKALADTAVAGIGLASAVPTAGIGLVVSLGVEGVSQTAGAIDKGVKAINKTVQEVTKQKKNGGLLMSVITLLIALLIPFYILVATPSILLLPITNALTSIIVETNASFLISFGNKLGIVSDDFYDSVKVAEVMDKYDLEDNASAVSVSSAMIVEMTGVLLELVHDDINTDITNTCVDNNYNVKLTLDTISDIEDIYTDINYAEIICIADQNPDLCGEVSYTKLQEYYNDKDNRKDLIVYGLQEAEISYTVEQLYSMDISDYGGLVGTGGEECLITYEKQDDTGNCNVANCNATGYSYASSHSISHGENESQILNGYYCEDHAPTMISHNVNKDNANEDELESDLLTYSNDLESEVGEKTYSFRYYIVTVYPYALKEMYAFFNVDMNATNVTYTSMSNYEALDARENWLRTYVDDVDLGSENRTAITNVYNYTSDIVTGDIFMEDIILENDGVYINLPSYYNQADERWASLTYWGDSTIKKSGCCLCAITMIADYFASNETVTPITIQGYGSPIMTSDYKVVRSAVCSVYGFKTYINGQTFDINTCMEELEQGRPVIVYYPATSNFTNNGHYAVINGYKYNEEGQPIFLTYDSGSRERTKTGVTFAEMSYNATTMWSYGK